jgi:hypothetical protein
MSMKLVMSKRARARAPPLPRAPPHVLLVSIAVRIEYIKENRRHERSISSPLSLYILRNLSTVIDQWSLAEDRLATIGGVVVCTYNPQIPGKC